jgi:hypothetical protein
MSATTAAQFQESHPMMRVQNILISQAVPAQRTQYDDLEKRFGVKIGFIPMIIRQLSLLVVIPSIIFSVFAPKCASKCRKK